MTMPHAFGLCLQPLKRTRLSLLISLLGSTLAGQAYAFSFDTGDSDFSARWDNTVKYSNAFRLKKQSGKITANPNLDDGDRNFSRGLASNRFDLFSELDIGTPDHGLRLSGAAWYDSVYNQKNDNNSPTTSNAVGHSYNEFSDSARTVQGRDAELLDAFIYNRTTVADMPLSVRLGRHSLVYGESLFFGNNGVAAAQGPYDFVKLVSVPGTQFKEVLRPTEQASMSLQLRPNLSVGAYYQFLWHPNRYPTPGSYFSAADSVGPGSESILVSAGPFGDLKVQDGHDIKAKNSGQGGMQIKWTPEGSDLEFGFYAARYNEKAPSTYIDLPAPLGNGTGLRNVYHEGVRLFGMSLSTAVNESLSLAGEISVRRNTSLNSNPVADNGLGDNDHNILYAVGNSAHAQISGIYSLSPGKLWDGGSMQFEVAAHRLTSITKNKEALDPGATRDASSMRMVFEPTYFQVLDGLDITVPIGLGYGLSGHSPLFSGGWNNRDVGDLSLGVNGTYRQVWKLGASYTHYLGEGNGVATAQGLQTYDQAFKDRDFLSFNISRTF